MWINASWDLSCTGGVAGSLEVVVSAGFGSVTGSVTGGVAGSVTGGSVVVGSVTGSVFNGPPSAAIASSVEMVSAILP
jgi:hypothetical protein